VTSAAAGELRLCDYAPRPRLALPVTEVDRSRVPCIDAHTHLGRWLTGGWAVPDVDAFVRMMDRRNVATAVNLDGRWGAELESNLRRYDRAHPGRFVTFCHADWRCLGRSGDGVGEQLAEELRAAVATGARGLKVWKDLGLRVRDRAGRLVLPDDERLSPLWRCAGELGVPVAIHTADPVAFFDPPDASNERLEELLAHPDWSYHRPGLPGFARLIAALEQVVAAHPRTTFLGVHVGCYAEDLGWVSRMLDTYPNFHVDIAARMAELGRQPRRARELILRHPGRVVFGTDGIPPDEAGYRTHFRFLETADEYFPYHVQHPPPQGRWMVYGLDLHSGVLARVYAENFRAILGQR
jgi:predicted TIM-barrel fold metal-dependent hydrolase